MKYQPINKRVLVKLIPLPDKTASGLHLPDTLTGGGPGQVQDAEVVATAGDAIYLVADSLQDEKEHYISFDERKFTVGSTVLVWPLMGQEVNIDGVKYRLLKDEEILAVKE